MTRDPDDPNVPAAPAEPPSAPGGDPFAAGPAGPELAGPELTGGPDGGASPVAGRWRIPAILAGGAVVVALLAGFMFMRRAIGSPLDAARAIPADADFAVTVDFLHFVREDRLDRLVEAFARPLRQAGAIDEDDREGVLDAIDRELEAELGITASDDIVPWIGRSAAFAMRDVAAASGPSPTGLVLAMDVRDRGAAERFVERLPELLETEGAGTVDEIDVAGRRVHRLQPALEEDAQLLFVLEADLLLFASDRATLRASFDAMQSESLVDDDAFREAIEVLEEDRGVTVYLATSLFDRVRDELDAAAAAGVGGADPFSGFDAFDRLQSVVGSAGLNEQGVWMDVSAVYDGDAPALLASDPPPLLDTLPASTLLFAGSSYDASALDRLIDAAREADPEGFDQFVAEAESLIGVDPVEDVLRHLGGGFSIAVVPAKAGILSNLFGVDLGLVAGLSVRDAASLGAAIDELVARFSSDGTVEFVADGPVTRVFVSGDEIFSYSLTDDALAAGTSAGVVADAVTPGGNALTSTALYQDLDSQLPGDGLQFYFDMQRAIDVATGGDAPPSDVAGLLPIRGFGAAATVEGELVTARYVMLVDYEVDFDPGT